MIQLLLISISFFIFFSQRPGHPSQRNVLKFFRCIALFVLWVFKQTTPSPCSLVGQLKVFPQDSAPMAVGTALCSWWLLTRQKLGFLLYLCHNINHTLLNCLSLYPPQGFKPIEVRDQLLCSVLPEITAQFRFGKRKWHVSPWKGLVYYTSMIFNLWFFSPKFYPWTRLAFVQRPCLSLL